jgi:hypothetical protein
MSPGIRQAGNRTAENESVAVPQTADRISECLGNVWQLKFDLIVAG